MLWFNSTKVAVSLNHAQKHLRGDLLLTVAYIGIKLLLGIIIQLG